MMRSVPYSNREMVEAVSLGLFFKSNLSQVKTSFFSFHLHMMSSNFEKFSNFVTYNFETEVDMIIKLTSFSFLSVSGYQVLRSPTREMVLLRDPSHLLPPISAAKHCHRNFPSQQK